MYVRKIFGSGGVICLLVLLNPSLIKLVTKCIIVTTILYKSAGRKVVFQLGGGASIGNKNFSHNVGLVLFRQEPLK